MLMLHWKFSSYAFSVLQSVKLFLQSTQKKSAMDSDTNFK